MASTAADKSSTRLRLPPEWPGKATINGALTMLRMAGHWGPWFATYAGASRQVKKSQYRMFRHRFYQAIYKIDADWAHRQGL